MRKKSEIVNLEYVNRLLNTFMLEVAALYRVSSPGQVNGEDDVVPIPAQKTAAEKLCESKKWNLVKEFIEPGVSAFRNSAMDRDVIHDVITDAKKGTFKILLVFKHTRLSRLEAEYPWILKELKKYGVIVWEIAQNRRLTPIAHAEALTAYIDGWMAEGESRNISENTRNGIISKLSKKQRFGGFTGYGFEIKERYIDNSGKKPKMRSIIGISEKESKIIEILVQMYERGHGSKYAAKQLNSNGYRTRSGAEWNSQYIRRILRNPAIAGIYLFRIDGQNPNRIHNYKDLYDPAYFILKDDEGNYITDPQLTIIQFERWFNLMKIMDSLSTGKHINGSATQIHLLTGFTRCGYCGRSMSAITASEQYQKKDGTYSIYDKSAYRCNGHTLGLNCNGPYQVNINKVNKAFYTHLELFFNNFDPEALICNTEEENKNINDIKKRIRRVEKELTKTERLKTNWLDELDEYFIREGDYILSKDNIANKINEQETKINQLSIELSELKKMLDSEISKKQNLIKLSKIIPKWYESFKDRPVEVQNQLLRNILSEVIIYRDTIEVVYSLNIAQMAKYQTANDNHSVIICKTIQII